VYAFGAPKCPSIVWRSRLYTLQPQLRLYETCTCNRLTCKAFVFFPFFSAQFSSSVSGLMSLGLRREMLERNAEKILRAASFVSRMEKELEDDAARCITSWFQGAKPRAQLKRMREEVRLTEEAMAKEASDDEAFRCAATSGAGPRQPPETQWTARQVRRTEPQPAVAQYAVPLISIHNSDECTIAMCTHGACVQRRVRAAEAELPQRQKADRIRALGLAHADALESLEEQCGDIWTWPSFGTYNLREWVLSKHNMYQQRFIITLFFLANGARPDTVSNLLIQSGALRDQAAVDHVLSLLKQARSCTLKYRAYHLMERCWVDVCAGPNNYTDGADFNSAILQLRAHRLRVFGARQLSSM
jgi:hypothetical protein